MQNQVVIACAYPIQKKNYPHKYPGPGNLEFPVKDSYFKSTFILAIGLDLHF